MAKWEFDGRSHRYEGGANPSADVDYGWKCKLIDRTSRREMYVNVEAASGPRDVELTGASARAAVAKYLSDDEPPQRIVMARDGSFYPEWPAASAS